VVVIVIVPVVVVAIAVDTVDEDADPSVIAAANPRAHRRDIAARADYADRRRLRDEDEVALKSMKQGVDRRSSRALSLPGLSARRLRLY